MFVDLLSSCTQYLVISSSIRDDVGVRLACFYFFLGMIKRKIGVNFCDFLNIYLSEYVLKKKNDGSSTGLTDRFSFFN